MIRCDALLLSLLFPQRQHPCKQRAARPRQRSSAADAPRAAARAANCVVGVERMCCLEDLQLGAVRRRCQHRKRKSEPAARSTRTVLQQHVVVGRPAHERRAGGAPLLPTFREDRLSVRSVEKAIARGNTVAGTVNAAPPALGCRPALRRAA